MLLINVFFAAGLQEIFNMIESLQIVILLPLLNVLIPANTGMFFNELTSIAAFDIFETNEFCLDALDLLPKDPINHKFEAMGLETVYFINNQGSFVFVLIFKILQVLLYMLLLPM